MPFSTIIRSRLYRNVKTNYIAICQRNSSGWGSLSLCGRARCKGDGGGEPENCMQSKIFNWGWLTEVLANKLPRGFLGNTKSMQKRTKDTSCKLKVCTRSARPALTLCVSVCVRWCVFWSRKSWYNIIICMQSHFQQAQANWKAEKCGKKKD